MRHSVIQGDSEWKGNENTARARRRFSAMPNSAWTVNFLGSHSEGHMDGERE